MTNTVAVFTNKLLITAAYKYVALTMMIAQANLFATKVDLPLDNPIAQTNVILSRCSVNPPRLMGFGGSVVTEKYLFGFGHGHLANFWQWEFHAESSPNIRAQQEEWAKMSSQIGANDVHQLALTWLADLGVDTATLERKYPCEIKQEFFYRRPAGSLAPVDQGKVPLPIFVISWGAIPIRGHPQYSFPAVSMTVFGPAKKLVEFHLLDDSLMLRPKLEIENSEQLLAISDTEFNSFDEMQRNNLVKQFTP